MWVVIDPNVLLSALIAPGGASDRAVRAVVARGTPIISPHLLDRFVQRAADQRFRRWFSVNDAEALAAQLSDLVEAGEDPTHVSAVVVSDPSDDYLVALARRSRADSLLTGDQGIHRALEDADDLRVVSPAELLDELSADAENEPEHDCRSLMFAKLSSRNRCGRRPRAPAWSKFTQSRSSRYRRVRDCLELVARGCGHRDGQVGPAVEFNTRTKRVSDARVFEKQSVCEGFDIVQVTASWG